MSELLLLSTAEAVWLFLSGLVVGALAVFVVLDLIESGGR